MDHYKAWNQTQDWAIKQMNKENTKQERVIFELVLDWTLAILTLSVLNFLSLLRLYYLQEETKKAAKMF